MTEPSVVPRSATELALPAGVRALAWPRTPRETIAGELAAHLPPGGMAAHRLPDRFSLARATRRLLDGRILTAAAEILDVDVLDPLVRWLGRADRVVRAAETTVVDPRAAERIEVVFPGRPFTHDLGTTVTVRVDGADVASMRFRLEMSARLGETSVVVRSGAIPEVVVDTLTVTAELSLVGWATPLWAPAPVELPEVRVTVNPPLPVPLIRVPPPRARVRPASSTR